MIPQLVFNTSYTNHTKFYKKESKFSFCRPWQKLTCEFENSLL
ncbi:hypothetical protein HMPREF9554_01644 [Treponema phagedenis F0421]|nr:hypothetical protein HMPREF9554_01644 [Treponema phagedenis F0421]